MQKTLIHIILFIFFLSTICCISFGKIDELEIQKNNPSQLSLQDIQGDWKCYDIACEKMCEICCENLIGLHFRISGDSVSFFEYPHQYFGTYKIETDSGKFVRNEKLQRVLNACFVNDLPNRSNHYIYSSTEWLYADFSKRVLRNDTLITNNYFFYKRDIFDDKIVNRLKKDSINRNTLIGQWQLKTKYEGYYGDDDHHVQPPFNMPKELTFTKETILPPTVKGKRVKIMVNNINCDFYISDISQYRFTLVPGKWYKKKDKVAIDYYRKD